MQKIQTPYGWWFNGHHNTKRSTWFESSLDAVEQRMEAILKLIEEDADSFSQRAEMYYEKRPQLISIIEDFYRTHRALLEQYDHLITKSSTKNQLQYNSACSELEEDSAESEVDDPESEHANDQVLLLDDNDTIEATKLLKEEIERLREENTIQKQELKQKDEEKMEVIRQLSLAVNLLKDDNIRLRKNMGNDTRNPFDLLRFKGSSFLKKLFHRSSQ